MSSRVLWFVTFIVPCFSFLVFEAKWRPLRASRDLKDETLPEKCDDLEKLENDEPDSSGTEEQTHDETELAEDTALAQPSFNASLDHFLNSTGLPIETTTVKMDETITLPRENCNVEIHVDETEDRKMNVRFGDFGKAIGQCQITLNGNDDVMLAVLITEIRLQNEKSCLKEALRIILTNTGINYTVKQYCGNEDHFPVVLTETHRVYLMYSYNITESIEGRDESSFSLEVFTYEKNENRVGTHEGISGSYPDSGKDVENIYFTTDKPEEADNVNITK